MENRFVQTNNKFRPEKFYLFIRKQKKKPASLCFISIPAGISLSSGIRKALQYMAYGRLVFLKEKCLIEKTASMLGRSRRKFDVVMSFGQRGKYVYHELKKHPNCFHYFRGLHHINVSISRKTVASLNLTKIPVNSRVLIVDDIFASGLTISSVLKQLPSPLNVTCLFLFGPRNTLRNFQKHSNGVVTIVGYRFTADPRTTSMEFTDLISVIELAERFGKTSELFLRVFGRNAEKAAELVKGLRFKKKI